MWELEKDNVRAILSFHSTPGRAPRHSASRFEVRISRATGTVRRFRDQIPGEGTAEERSGWVAAQKGEFAEIMISRRHSRDPDCSTEGLVVISKKRGGIVIIGLTVGLTAAPLYHHSTSDVGDEHRHQLGLGGHEPARSGHRLQGRQKQEAGQEEARAQAPPRGTEKESARVEHHEGTPLLQ